MADIHKRYGKLFEGEPTAIEAQAGVDMLQSRWGSMLTLKKLAEQSNELAALYGRVEPITKYKVHQIFNFLMLDNDINRFKNKVTEIATKKK